MRATVRACVLTAVALEGSFGCASWERASYLGPPYQAHPLRGQDAAQLRADEAMCFDRAKSAGDRATTHVTPTVVEWSWGLAWLAAQGLLAARGATLAPLPIPHPHSATDVQRSAATLSYLGCLREHGYDAGEHLYRHPLGGAPISCRTDACQDGAAQAGYVRR